MARFPRRIRRGLIEALSVTSGASASRYFPGEFAGASLKRDHAPRGAQAAPHFPGEFAGASLKQRAQCDAHQAHQGISRRIRRGLIEASRPRCPWSDRTGFPRRIGRGLIEAALTSPCGACAASISPANSPASADESHIIGASLGFWGISRRASARRLAGAR